MELLGNINSPYVRKILLLTIENKIENNVPFKKISFANDMELIDTLSPLRKIPVLKLDDGTGVIESDLISRYLSDKFKLQGVFPSSFHLKFENHLAIINGGLDASVDIIREKRRDQNQQDAKNIEKATLRISQVLLHIQKFNKEIFELPTYLQYALASFVGSFRVSSSEYQLGRQRS